MNVALYQQEDMISSSFIRKIPIPWRHYVRLFPAWPCMMQQRTICPREANIRKAIKLQAQLPTVVAAFARIREGKEPIAPKKGVGIAA